MESPPKRPWIVTVISWLFMAYALFSLIPKGFVILSPEAYQMTLELNATMAGGGLIDVPFSFQLAHAFIGVPVTLISGIFMLKGRLWALGLLLLWMAGALVLTLLVAGLSMSLYGRLIGGGLVTVLLTRSHPWSYFSSRP
ncbi:MAG: hypothetical protein V3R94_03785 [Acidobacteriota bacterium]